LAVGWVAVPVVRAVVADKLARLRS